MVVVEREVDRILTLVRNKIRERGFTQLEVQESLGWGRSYISQLLTKQKSLRVEQVLLILNVIGCDPAEFYAELYHFPQAGVGFRGLDEYPSFEIGGAPFNPSAVADGGDGSVRSFNEVRSMVRGLVQLLVDKNVINLDELTASVNACEAGTVVTDPDPAAE